MARQTDSTRNNATGYCSKTSRRTHQEPRQQEDQRNTRRMIAPEGLPRIKLRKRDKAKKKLDQREECRQSNTGIDDDSERSKGHGAFSLIGRSSAGHSTSFVIPELKWVFDTGLLFDDFQWPPKALFLTHTHADHIQCLPQILSRWEQLPRNQAKLYMPASAVQLMRDYLEAYDSLTRQSLMAIFDACVHPVEPDEIVPVDKHYVFQALSCEHRIDCLGYSILRRKQQLKPEYQHVPGKEIAKLRKEGKEVVNETEEPIICFMGDTTHVVLQRYPKILQDHHTVVIECSFVDESDVGRARETMHMHWSNLKPFVESNPDTLFVLTHFSRKHTSLYLRKFFRGNATHNNIHPMLSDQQILKEFETAGLVDGREELLCNCFHCTDRS